MSPTHFVSNIRHQHRCSRLKQIWLELVHLTFIILLKLSIFNQFWINFHQMANQMISNVIFSAVSTGLVLYWFKDIFYSTGSASGWTVKTNKSFEAKKWLWQNGEEVDNNIWNRPLKSRVPTIIFRWLLIVLSLIPTN